MTTAMELRQYLLRWSDGSTWVTDTLEWTHTPRAMPDICRLGAWLGDTVYTELCITAGTHYPNVRYVVVSNSSYKELAPILGCDSESLSALRVGNIFEHLMWLALEEDRCEWILAVLRCVQVNDARRHFRRRFGF